MRSIPVLIILTLICTAKSGAADAFSTGKIRTFISYLADRGEYYRAHVELKRLKSLHPGYLSREQFHLTENYLLFQGKQYDAILAKKVECSGPVLCPAHRLFRFDSMIAGLNFHDAGHIAASWQYGENAFLDEMARKRKLMILLMRKEYGLARDLVGEFNGGKLERYWELIDHSRRRIRRIRQPAGAVLLGLLPGMGYMYAGDYATGIITFLVLAVNATVTGLAFYTGNDVIGYLTGAVGICFYAGSMAGGYLATRRNNRRISREVRDYLELELSLPQDRKRLYERIGLGNDGKR
jgi:TM2 domain-containing membrane protein YozV